MSIALQCILGMAFAVPRLQEPAAVPAVSVSEHLQRCVVKLSTLCPMPLAVASGEGSGFFVEEGVLATNWHVVSRATQAMVVLADQRTFPVREVLAASRIADLALLRVEIPEGLVPCMDFEEAPPRAQDSLVLGTLESLTEDLEREDESRVREFTLHKGNLRSVRRFEGFGELLCMTLPLEEGMSGSAIVSAQSGRVVGIACLIAEENTSQSLVSYAIPVDRLRALCAAAHGSAPLATSLERWHLKRQRDPESIVELARTLLEEGLAERVLDLHLLFERANERLRETERQEWPREGWYYKGHAHLALAISAEENGEDEDALSHYEAARDSFSRALRTQPRSAFDCLLSLLCQYHYGDACMELGDLPQARAAILEYQREEPDDPDGYYLLGAIAARIKDTALLELQILELCKRIGDAAEEVNELRAELKSLRDEE